MIRNIIILSLLLIPAALTAADECLDCHSKETPGAVSQWQQSLHAEQGLSCNACHGNDHDAIVQGNSPVSASVCGRCHEDEFRQHSQSRHGLGLHAGWGCTRALPDRDPRECLFCHEEGSTLPKTRVQCARFLKQSSEMGQLGCNRCHQVETNCASCHSNHLTDAAIARDPKVCAKCHMGPDHPQWEMWETSMHGILHGSAGAGIGPDCQRCHMPSGTHDVSLGLTSPPSMKPYKAETRGIRRREMLGICVDCHSREFSSRELEQADAIRDQSLALVREAEEIIRDLYDRGLLEPMPEARPPHPTLGEKLVLDGQMLYEDYSRIERLFFKMKKFSLAKTVKGAYHQNPAYTHWYGNAELKMDLVDIRAEAARLKSRASGASRAAPTAGSIEDELRTLKKKFERGAISEAEYEALKKELLDRSFDGG